MKIGLYKIGTDIIGIDIEFWSDSELNGNPAFIYSETLTSDYHDISNDLLLIEKFGENVMSYNSKRNFMIPVFYSEAGTSFQNFSGMTSEKKMIAAKYFFIPYSIRLTLLTESEDAANWSSLVRLTEDGRAKMVEAMRVKVSDFVRSELYSKSDSELFFEDCFSMLNAFIKAASTRLKDFISNKIGTEYELNGFEQASYYNEDLKIELLKILSS